MGKETKREAKDKGQKAQMESIQMNHFVISLDAPLQRAMQLACLLYANYGARAVCMPVSRQQILLWKGFNLSPWRNRFRQEQRSTSALPKWINKNREYSQAKTSWTSLCTSHKIKRWIQRDISIFWCFLKVLQGSLLVQPCLQICGAVLRQLINILICRNIAEQPHPFSLFVCRAMETKSYHCYYISTFEE